MVIEAENAGHLAKVARETGADVLEGTLRYPSRTGGWQLGNVDLGDYLSRYRDQRLMVVLVPVGAAYREQVTCDVCGYAMDEGEEECPRCKLIAEYTTDIERRIQERGQLFEEAG
ncbi:MAG: hypothetical protein Kow0063_14170 [Anaerolineae bacterium]